MVGMTVVGAVVAAADVAAVVVVVAVVEIAAVVVAEIAAAIAVLLAPFHANHNLPRSPRLPSNQQHRLPQRLARASSR